jgi:transmembrane sensor
MHRQDFIALLQRYLDDTCTPAEKQVMDYWYDLLDEEYDEKISTISREELEGVLWAKIKDKIEPAEQVVPLHQEFRWWQNRRLYWAAASVLLMIGLFYILSLKTVSLPPLAGITTTETHAGMHREHNRDSTSKWIVLEDSTRILLQPGSSVRYDVPFSPHLRSVYLSGDAFFEVTKNEQRPFIVHSGDIVTRVVGTSFGIQFREDGMEVSVTTGKVIVEKALPIRDESLRPASNGVVLTPNQKVTYYSKDHYFVTGLVENPQPITLPLLATASLEDSFQFESVPLVQVLSHIEAAYGVKIVLTNQAIETCPVTADLSQQSLYSKMDILCAALRATFEVKGTSLVLSGGNCD